QREAWKGSRGSSRLCGKGEGILLENPFFSWEIPRVSLYLRRLGCGTTSRDANIGIYSSGMRTSGYIPVGCNSSWMRYIPSECIPSGCIPSECIPSGYIPSGCIPSEYIPLRCIPSGYIPLRCIPPGYIPSGSIPSGSIPSGCNPIKEPHSSPLESPKSDISHPTGVYPSRMHSMGQVSIRRASG
uniref:Uncharacterized protein n=1 Tax=Cyanistes caeruleus TaxID=156563 RepID=A0A8C0UB91_CYACU